MVTALPRLAKCEITMRSVFLQGLLLMPSEAAATRVRVAAAALDRWHAWCADKRSDPLTAALSVGKGIDPDYVVVGVDNTRQLDEIAAAWNAAEPLAAPTLAVTDAAVIDPRTWSGAGR